ncbi:MAG: hypothetical protein GF398_03520 [Chitinivibrionales bacterium]|nr:hypothetical protein [Chitinivibrionales bacterium]
MASRGSMMRLYQSVVMVYLSLCASATAAGPYDTLAGNLPDLVEDNGKPYLVTADIVVPFGKTIIIEPGVVLLFKNFTGMQVHGTLQARGTPKTPIYFTSENDSARGSLSQVKPAPYDWNGITINENALGTTFEHCCIYYSLFGINSLAQFIRIKECRFFRNGKSNLVINGQREDTGDNEPFSLAAPSNVELPDEVSQSISRKLATRMAFRISGATLLIGGGAFTAWKALSYQKSQARFDKLNDPDDPGNQNDPDIDDKWEDARKQKKEDLLATFAGSGAALIGAIGFGFSFMW